MALVALKSPIHAFSGQLMWAVDVSSCNHFKLFVLHQKNDLFHTITEKQIQYSSSKDTIIFTTYFETEKNFQTRTYSNQKVNIKKKGAYLHNFNKLGGSSTSREFFISILIILTLLRYNLLSSNWIMRSILIAY